MPAMQEGEQQKATTPSNRQADIHPTVTQEAPLGPLSQILESYLDLQAGPGDPYLLHIRRPCRQVGVVCHPPPAALEQRGVDGIKAGYGGKEAEVSFRDPALHGGVETQSP